MTIFATVAGALRMSLKAFALAAALLIAPLAGRAAPASVNTTRDSVEARQGGEILRITALTDTILRVRMTRNGHFPEDASWAVPAPVRARTIVVHPTADGFTTASLVAHVTPDLRLIITDLNGRAIVADDPEPLRHEGRGFTLRKQLPHDEHIFALGDKTGGTLDRRGESFVDWNTDAYGFSSATDPIYKSIPFYIGVGGAGGAYGILFDNTWRAWFDFGHRESDVTSFGAPDGPIDYYVVAGPSLAEVVRRYTDLTGKPPLAPLWALGYQQSRYSYMSANEVNGLVSRLRKEAIPTDVVWLDIDYQDRNRPFTVNRTAFPDLAGLTTDLRKQGIRLVTIADLHVAAVPGQSYAPYDTGVTGNHFVHNPDGSVFIGIVWPGASVFPDFTDASARQWWGKLHAGLLDAGVAGIWNDMNEPSVFETPSATMPLDAVHRIASDDFAPRDASHAELHNVYGMEDSRATFEGLYALQPDERAFVMTRASYAGGQRYAVTWTGDNSATWDHLKLSVHQLINLGLSGFSYAGADVGGFTGGSSPELMTRWFEIAAFMPIFRDHSAKGTPRAEPWVDGPDQLGIRRRFVEQRYRLMPYLYALADLNARTGDPLMRPVFYDYPAMLGAPCDQSMAFTLGSALLIAPSPKPESSQSYDVCLPGGGWYDLWSGLAVTRPTVAAEPVIDKITEAPRLEHLPVYVRAGTILPTQPLVQSTAVTPRGSLLLDLYPGPDCKGVLYLDDGHSMGFQHGAFLRQTIRCETGSDGMLTISFGVRDGHFHPWWHGIAITVHGWEGDAVVRATGTIVTRVSPLAHALRVELPDQRGATRISLLPKRPS